MPRSRRSASGFSPTAPWSSRWTRRNFAPQLAGLKARGFKAVAIVFMHAWRFPDQSSGRLRCDRPGDGLPAGLGQPRGLAADQARGRGDTTVVDAYLSPILRRYVGQVSEELDVARTGARLMFMMSSGGLTAAEALPGQGCDPLRVPPAAVVGMAEDGACGRLPEGDRPSTWAAPRPMSPISTAATSAPSRRRSRASACGAPMMLIHTVAAGGGSILHFDGQRFRCGPGQRRRQSRTEGLSQRRAACGDGCERHGRQAAAGSLPGDLRARPQRAARRRGGARRFRCDCAESAGGRSPEAVADGFITIAVENMANAIKKISVQRGYDVTRYALNCFGGAGGQHACLVADALGMTTILIHPFSGLLSAYGMGLADIRRTRQQAVEAAFDEGAAPPSDGGSATRRRGRRPRWRGRGAGRATSRSSWGAHPLCGGPIPRWGRGLGKGMKSPPSTLSRTLSKQPSPAFRFIDETKPIVIEAVSVEAVGGGANSPRQKRRREQGAAGAGEAHALLLRRAVPRGPRSTGASSSSGRESARTGADHRAEPDDSWWSPAGGRSEREGPSRADPRRSRCSARSRSARRPIR